MLKGPENVMTEPAEQAEERPGGGWRGRLLWTVVTVMAAVGLFWCYLAESRTYSANADGSGVALQGWDMLHGNLLLSGWWTADVSFYTFEVPLDALVEAVRGLNPDVTHVSAAIAYTALTVVAALLARGAARGPEGVARAAVTAGILLAAPGRGQSTGLLLGSPDHIGVCVPILLSFLLIDHASRRWWVPAVLCVLLVWGQLDDPTASFAAAFAIAVVCLSRAALGLLRRDGRADGGRADGERADEGRVWTQDAALGVAAVLSYVLTEAAVGAIRDAGGYSMRGLSAATAGVPVSHWGIQLLNTGHNVLVLFGADFYDRPGGLVTLIAVARFVGVVLAAGGLLAGIASLARLASLARRGWPGRLDGLAGRDDRVTQVVTVGTLVTLGAGAFLTPMTRGYAAHEIAVVLPFTAVLAGRAVAPALLRGAVPLRLVPLRPLLRMAALSLLVAVGACYLVILGYNASQPGLPARAQSLADALGARHLTSGLGPYWAGNAVTVASGGRTHIAAMGGDPRNPYSWLTRPGWYDPGRGYANFVIGGTGGMSYPVPLVLRVYGEPAREYRFGTYVIMVYDRNLLREVKRPVQPDPETGLHL